MNIAEVYRHSMVIASDYRIPDPSRVAPLLQKRRAELSRMGAHHVLVYQSTREPGRVLVMIGVRSREPVVELLRSRAFFDYFDSVGVEEFPAVFAGEIVEKFDLTDPRQGPESPGVIVSAFVSVSDVQALVGGLRAAESRFRDAGIRRLWVFGAFDDAQEVMVLQEIDDEDSARRWIDRPDAAAEWMSHAGVGVYPPLFVGEFVSMMAIDRPE
nr:fatty-acid--CoA ligase [Mycolicibacterium palauense]